MTKWKSCGTASAACKTTSNQGDKILINKQKEKEHF